MFTARVFCRRDTVLKSGTDQSSPLSCKRLSTKPVVYLSAMPNSTFIPSRALCLNALPGNGQAGLDRGVAIGELAATLSGRLGLPRYLGIEPDCQRTPALERFIVGPPVPDLVGRG